MTPGQLVHAMAVALDVSEETVVLHDRNLAVAGLRTKGGRGTSAAKVTPLDAARLFVAVLASMKAKDSALAVLAFEQLEFVPPWLPSAETIAAETTLMVAEAKELGISLTERDAAGQLKPPPPDPAISSLPAKHNLIEAIAALIGDASSLGSDVEQYLRRFAPLAITCERPWPRAEIYHYDRSIRRFPARYGMPSKLPSKDSNKPTPPPIHETYARSFGIGQKREATGTALIVLGKAFRDNGLDQFETARDAMDALLGVKKPAGKSKKKAA